MQPISVTIQCCVCGLYHDILSLYQEFEILSQIGQLQAFCSCYSLPVDQTISAWLQNHTMLNDQESNELSRALEHPVDPCPNSPSSWSQRLLNKKLPS